MTLLAWMLYASVVTFVIGGAAWLTDRALDALDLPRRWAWAAALVAAVTLSASALLPGGGGDFSTAPALRAATEAGTEEAAFRTRGPEALPGTILAVPATLSGALQRTADLGARRLGPYAPADRTIASIWALGASLLFVVWGGATLRLAARLRRWPRARVDGRPVRIAPRLGPAVVGMVAPTIVLPPWAMSLDAHRRRSILVHEEEHQRAGDTRLLGAGTALVLACFWNPGLWWAFRRLRAAVEMDCDQRVLARGIPRSEYGALLIEVGARARRTPCPAPALAEPSNLLFTRLQHMKTRRVRHPHLTSLGAVLTACILVAVACETDAPMPTAASDGAAPDAEVLSETIGEPAGQRLPFLRPPSSAEGEADEAASDAPMIYVDGVGVRAGQAAEDPAPLFIVDGVIVNADRVTAELDPGSVETIEVIRGARAEELYGSRARHGVVIVTSRRP